MTPQAKITIYLNSAPHTLYFETVKEAEAFAEAYFEETKKPVSIDEHIWLKTHSYA